MAPSAMQSPGAAALLAFSARADAPTKHADARAAAEDFEAVFLNAMFSQMFTDIDGEGPFGGGKETGVWRSFLTEEYSKSLSKAGGIGLADGVYRALLAQQEVK